MSSLLFTYVTYAQIIGLKLAPGIDMYSVVGVCIFSDCMGSSCRVPCEPE